MFNNKCIKLCFAITIVLPLLRAAQSVSVKNPRAASGNPSSIHVKDDLTSKNSVEIIKMAKAAEMHAMHNMKADPCHDFYDFACGNWNRYIQGQLPNQSKKDRFQLLAKAFDRRLEQILVHTDSEDAMEAQVKGFYHSCLKIKLDKVHYKKSLENIYREFGELPILGGNKWNEGEFVWWETIAKIQHKYGKQIILAVDIMGNVRSRNGYRAYVGPQSNNMTRNSLILHYMPITKSSGVVDEATTIKNLEHHFGVESPLATQAAQEMVEFERELALVDTNDNLGEASQNLLTPKVVNELNQAFNESVIDMKRYLELALGGDVPESIYVYNEKYFEHMTKLIASKPKRILANYILWQLLQEYLVDATEADLPKWCIARTKIFLGEYVDHIVYKRYKDPKMEAEIYQVWEDVRNVFRIELASDKLNWMSNDTRKHAIEKLDAMELQISSYEDTDFATLYGDVNFEHLNYAESVQAILMQKNKRNLENMHGFPSSFEAADVPSLVPSYNIHENKIKVPVALLQPLYLWDLRYPQAVKYGTLGYLIAHEMIHGFDDEGRGYDKHGNVARWWDERSRYYFVEHRKCFQDQYRDYEYGGRKLPANISISESIAQSGGVRLALLAYARRYFNKITAEIRRSEEMPTYTFNGPQLFFFAYAQLWCDDAQNSAPTDKHLPGRYRVISSLSNYKDFFPTFYCGSDTQMNTATKCVIF